MILRCEEEQKMKTFKLVALTVVVGEENENRHPIELLDGLIINQEDGENHWTIEALVESKYVELFQELDDEKKPFTIQATITKPSNDPATFKVSVAKITVFEHTVSILLDGILLARKLSIAETILEDLISRGLEGEQLLEHFKERIHYKTIPHSK